MLIAGLKTRERSRFTRGVYTSNVWRCIMSHTECGTTPQSDGAVVARAGQLPAVRMECNRHDIVGVAGQHGNALTPLDRPEPDGAVAAGRCDQRAVGADRQSRDRVVVAFQNEPLAPARNVPDSDNAVIAGGH